LKSTLVNEELIQPIETLTQEKRRIRKKKKKTGLKNITQGTISKRELKRKKRELRPGKGK